MTTEERRSLETEISTALQGGLDVAEIFAPEAKIALIIGRAVAKYVPQLAEDVAAFFEKEDPTEQDASDLAKSIASLIDPDPDSIS